MARKLSGPEDPVWGTHRNIHITMDNILGLTDVAQRKTKIICTMGPSCWSKERLVEMLDAGMNVARLNFSHGDHASHAKTVENLRAALKERPGRVCAILLDTKGPEIRTGLLKNHTPIDLVAGQELLISTDYDLEGDLQTIACSYTSLPRSVKPGSPILMADGLITCTVLECLENAVRVRVNNNAKLGEKKNMNLPGVIVDLPTITAKDEDDLVNFGIPYGCDVIAASFVRKGSDITTIRDVLGPRGRHIKIIAKIENQEGLENYDDILREADGIMVARGDLGMEIPPEKVFLAQKMMIAKANVVGKPVITATQMLESMIKNPRPTRAEATDVANAVLDGSDCVMLSGETANGDWPLAAVEIMARVCAEAERCLDSDYIYGSIRACVKRPMSTPEAVGSSAVKTAIDMDVKMILVLTETGHTARVVAKYRPRQFILALSANEHVIRQLQLTRGTICFRIPSFQGTDSLIRSALNSAKQMGLCASGDAVVAIHGVREEVPGSSNLLKIVTVE
eukprot:GILK01000483.1.p1 GENE.GILK01000483.1~~GILK01000483.1.p1  ORF type:complete len:511 (-),score=106.74 GILK01000483.1:182-1714(-)